MRSPVPRVVVSAVKSATARTVVVCATLLPTLAVATPSALDVLVAGVIPTRWPSALMTTVTPLRTVPSLLRAVTVAVVVVPPVMLALASVSVLRLALIAVVGAPALLTTRLSDALVESPVSSYVVSVTG
jgi:hypothetical protein